MPRRISIPKDLKEFARELTSRGHVCYFVGGAVRDSLLGQKPEDWDAATDARPEEVMATFRRVIPTGIQHGTVTVLWKGRHVETTTFRVDGEYRDGRRPQAVRFTDDLLLDLSRRDFTINGMAADPESGQVVDPHGGADDLAMGRIRAIGNPLERFDEDGLRPLRAIRFACRFGFSIEEATAAAIPGTLERFRQVSAERVRDELSKILVSPRPSFGVRLLDSTGLLPHIAPELSACKGVAQGGPHRYDVFEHLLASCDAARPELVMRLAALLHDIAKPSCRLDKGQGELAFHGHDTQGAAMAAAILKRLKFPNAVTERVMALIRHHMFDYADSWTDAAVRRFVSRAGRDLLEDLIQLRLADMAGVSGKEPDPRVLMPLVRRVKELEARAQAFTIRDLAIKGDDLALAGWPRGPAMGRVLAELLEAVLEDPELNRKDRLLIIADRLKGKHGVA